MHAGESRGATMSPTITNTTGESELSGLAQKIGNRMLSTVSQGQQLSVDVAAALLTAQCDLALKLADVLVTDDRDSPMLNPDM